MIVIHDCRGRWISFEITRVALYLHTKIIFVDKPRTNSLRLQRRFLRKKKVREIREKFGSLKKGTFG
jgi:hypothetical protein